MLTKTQTLSLIRRADALSRAFPIGTPCHFWPGAKEGEGRSGKIRSAFAVIPCGELVVWIEGYPGCIAATHVECGGRGVLEAVT